jgi:HEPN domain-containing protein
VAGTATPFTLVQLAINDLQAAQFLRAGMGDVDRQVLKLLDDAAELLLKATLRSRGIDCERASFPSLIRACGPILRIPEELEAMHMLRNRVKHIGESASPTEIAAAFEAVMTVLLGLAELAGVWYAYCIKCKSISPAVDPKPVNIKPLRRAVKGWCFRCNTPMYRILPPGQLAPPRR